MEDLLPSPSPHLRYRSTLAASQRSSLFLLPETYKVCYSAAKLSSSTGSCGYG
jgi:hypothetical protein